MWGQRSGVEVITRKRGADPASVCYEVIDEAEKRGSELVLIDTAGRLHTSPELMRELAKVVNVTRKRASMPVAVVLVVDATTGQNGLSQAREFNEALDLDGLIVTKLDGTAKGGIVVAISHELKLPIWRIGVGEGIDDLQAFDALEFTRALVGGEDKRDITGFAATMKRRANADVPVSSKWYRAEAADACSMALVATKRMPRPFVVTSLAHMVGWAPVSASATDAEDASSSQMAKVTTRPQVPAAARTSGARSLERFTTPTLACEKILSLLWK